MSMNTCANLAFSYCRWNSTVNLPLGNGSSFPKYLKFKEVNLWLN